MKTIITHPDNLAHIKAKLISKGVDRNGDVLPEDVFCSVPIRTNAFLDRDKPTGKYIVDGKVVDKEEIKVEERFVVYGPEDLDYLLYAGLIEEERKWLFYGMDDSFFSLGFMGHGFK